MQIYTPKYMLKYNYTPKYKIHKSMSPKYTPKNINVYIFIFFRSIFNVLKNEKKKKEKKEHQMTRVV